MSETPFYINGAPAVRPSEKKEAPPWLRPELVASWREIWLVLAVMLGPFIYSSLDFVLKNHTSHFLSIVLSDPRLLRLAAVEALLLAGFFIYVRWRGWKAEDFCVKPTWQGTFETPVVAIIAFLLNAITVYLLVYLILTLQPNPHGLLAGFLAQAPHIPPHSIHVSWYIIFGGSILNAFLEELVFMGYAFNQFAAKRGPFFALMVMVFLRMLLHTYQGPVHMLGIAAFSIFYGFAYWYLRRLWPLILAHALIDIFSFSLVKILHGA